MDVLINKAKGLATALLLALVLATTFSACDSFLDKEPLGQATASTFFTTERDAIAATNATYSTLRNFNTHVFPWLGMTSIISDEATKGSTPNDGGTLIQLEELTFQADNSAFSGTWEWYYRGIYRANVAIQNIPDISEDAISEDMRARLIAENKFLRAYYYFFLVRAFGSEELGLGVPLITEPLETGEFDQVRAPLEEVWALIEQDLTDAAADLPAEYGAGDEGRATSGAANGFLAKVHLFQEEYPEAQQLAEAVINSGVYSLEPDYSFIFTPDGEFSSGSVWEIQNTPLEMGGGSSQYGQVQGVRGFPNLGWGFNQPSDFLETLYEPGDPRQQATILYPWESLDDAPEVLVHINTSIPNQQYNEKAQPELEVANELGSGNSSVNIRRLRYADVLLIAAEAAYRNGSVGMAQNYLNQVRQRAREGQSATLGIQAELVNEQLATENLGLPEGSRVFVRYVNTDSPAEGMLQALESSFLEQEGLAIPALISNMDIIQAVNGTTVTTVDEFESAVSGAGGGTVNLSVLRVTQQDDGGTVTTTQETLDMDVAAVPLLPDVTATGQALLEAIWNERGVELAMEQHRWFDILRQGRAGDLLIEAGIIQSFDSRFNTFPIPQSEIELTGGQLEQNPGYSQ